jgi:hypothetical protein
MPKGPAPYTWPHRSRAAIREYLLERRGRLYGSGHYPFVWNVKVYSAEFDGPCLRTYDPTLDPALDSEWDSYVESNGDQLFWHWCEDAGRGISEGEWTSYPGDDQGDWEFGFEGRSGGWIVLEKWRGRDVRNFAPFSEWSWPDLVAFYRGIRCADSDFTQANAVVSVEDYAAAYRADWEAEKREEAEEEAESAAASMAAARPDLAPIWEGVRA